MSAPEVYMWENRPVFRHMCSDGRESTQVLSDAIWSARCDPKTHRVIDVVPSLHCSVCNLHGWWREGRWHAT